ncbi:hypothetical protein OAA18_00335 [bacterium]|nr:hypothetical protein [bacterium]
MEKIYLKKEEIEELTNIQEQENQIILQLGQLEYQIANLQLQKESINQQLLDFNKQRSLAAKNLQNNYGEGSINLDSGEFIKNS